MGRYRKLIRCTHRHPTLDIRCFRDEHPGEKCRVSVNAIITTWQADLEPPQ